MCCSLADQSCQNIAHKVSEVIQSTNCTFCYVPLIQLNKFLTQPDNLVCQQNGGWLLGSL